MTEEKNAVFIKNELLRLAKEYRRKAKEVSEADGGSALYHAALLAKPLCVRARSTAKAIGSYKTGFAEEEGLSLSYALAESFIENNREISESKLRLFLSETGKKYESVTLSFLGDMLFTAAFKRIAEKTLANDDVGLSALLRSADRLRFIDFTGVFLDFSVSNSILSDEKAGVYPHCDEKTKLAYISAICDIAKKEGKKESDKALSTVKRADSSGVHVGSLLFPPRKGVRAVYSVCLLFMTLLITLIYFFLCDSNIFVLFTLPAAAVSCYGAVKELLSVCFRYAGKNGLMRMDRKSAKAERAVIAVMTVLSGAQGDGEIFERLENFYLSDTNKNRFYAVVFNLPDSEKKRSESDDKIISEAFARTEALNRKYGGHFGIFLRERRYSRSERKYIGWERKRGAVLELCRFMRGEKTSIHRYIADTEFLRKTKYLITLDSDTNLYAGAGDELIGVMLHPLNKPVVKNGAVVSGHGIIQPHIAPTLESASATPFATVTAGNGGIDSYASAAFDIYENVFESGSFCGKGILDVDVFLETCADFFPNERILSHDLLEGNLTGAAIASDITLTDSTPKNAVSYYTRMHRWIRGDLQTVPYLFPHVKNSRGEEIKNPMGILAKYKIADNLISSLCPFSALVSVFFIALTARRYAPLTLLFTFSYMLFPILRAVISLFLPGEAKKAARRFHAKIMPHIAGGFYYAFYKICALPYEAYIFADALVRTAYRFFVSKRNFLNWKTAADADTEKNGFSAYLSKMYFSFIAGAFALLLPHALIKVLGILWLCFPFAAFLLSLEKRENASVSDAERAQIKEYAWDIWRFFRDTVGESTNHLPPDNIAVSPNERIAYRTSPTNIGLYLASLLGARDMGFISSGEMADRAEKTLRTLGSMLTWRGHLYNWYDIKTLGVLGEPFVSTVDSGNFVCSLIAFSEGLKEYAHECPKLLDIIRSCEDIVKAADFSALYDPASRLFYIGYDAGKERYSESYYDTFMSESRMTGYFAAASGQVPREHFFAPSRAAVASGAYTGVASWSGTVFEYFMPALFLPVVPDSLSDEALSFAYRTERKKAVKRTVAGKKIKVFGVSESGYWHFDSEMNYQYKAFGLSSLSLDPACADAPVISPYSSFLMLRCGVSECLENLSVLKKLGAYGKYGFYEAVDFDGARVGGGYAIVKSFMAHHMGMSFIASVNALTGDIFPERFMRSGKMRAFGELLCEKIDVGVRALSPHREKRKSAEQKMRREPEHGNSGAKTRHNPVFPDAAMLSNNKMRVLASSSGHIALYSGEKALFLSEFNRFSLGSGLRFRLVADGEAYPLTPLSPRTHGTESFFGFEYDDEKIVYSSRHENGDKEIYAHLTLRVFWDREIFSAECRVKGDVKTAYLFAYAEPVMEEEKSFYSHKSFSGLFTESKYSSDEDILLFARRPRTGTGVPDFLSVRAYPPVYGGAFDTKRREKLPLMYGDTDIADLAGKELSRTQGATPVPMLAMRTYSASAKKPFGFLFAFASGEEEALYLISEKNNFSSRRFSELSKLRHGVSGMGIKAEAIKNYLLRSFLFPQNISSEKYARCPRDIFWKRGISGENHTAAVRINGSESENIAHLSPLIGAFKYMCICGERFDLIIIYAESDLYRNSVRHAIEACIEKEGCRNFIGRDNGIHVLSESSFEQKELSALLSLCEVNIDAGVLSSDIPDVCAFFELSRETEEKLLKKADKEPVGICHVPKEEIISENPCGYFTENAFTVKKPHGTSPFAHIMANEKFGCVVSENSLGFSYYENSALGKLTPHTADGMREDAGERLILRIYANAESKIFEDFDLCAVASSVTFSEGSAVYRGNAGAADFVLEVSVDKNAPVKRICAEISSQMKIKASLFLSAVPCIGERTQKSGRYIFEKYEKGIVISTFFENPVSLAVFADAENAVLFDGEAAFISDGSVYFGVNEIAAVGAPTEAAGEKISFYISALTPDFTREKLAELIQNGDFSPYRAESIFGKAEIKTKDALFDLSVNYFFPYQTYYSRFLARSGFYQVGGAYGFRDQLQDSLSFIENAPSLCREQILRCAAHQYAEGDVAHWWHVYCGKETGLRSRYSDDLLWLPLALCEYAEKTGDTEILSVSVPYLSSPPLDRREKERYEELHCEGEGTVYEHALLAAKLAYLRGFGKHSLLKFGGGDWNDGMNLVGIRGEGESVWLTEFCAIVYIKLAKLCLSLGDTENADFFESSARTLEEGVKKAFSDGWYLRGYYDSGEPLGKKGADECEIDSLSQSFAVFLEALSGGDISGNTLSAIDSAYKKLFSEEYGVFRLLCPPFDKGEQKPGYIKGYLPGIRENGGQYTHAAVWAAMALLISGNTDGGIKALKAINPVSRSAEKGFTERYAIEPYALAGDVYTHGEYFGHGGWSHYTGAAAWYRKAVLTCVFGVTLKADGFFIIPHMNEEFDASELRLNIKDTRYTVRFSFCSESGLVVDGRIKETDESKMKEFFFPFDGAEHTVDYCIAEGSRSDKPYRGKFPHLSPRFSLQSDSFIAKNRE